VTPYRYAHWFVPKFAGQCHIRAFIFLISRHNMHTHFRRRTLALATLAVALVAGSSSALAQDKNTVKVGVSVGSAEQVFEVVKKVAAKDGLNIQLVVFNDYQLPNAALASGDLDANAFQHQPFLDNQNKARGFDIVPVGLTITAPLGF